jgi:hypothetical protein
MLSSHTSTEVVDPFVQTTVSLSRHARSGDKTEAPYEVAGEAIIYDPAAISQHTVELALEYRRRRRGRLQAIVPLIAAAAIFTPHGPLVSEARPLPPVVAIRESSRREAWGYEWDDDDFWTYAPDLVTADQVRALDALMALPIPPELVIHFDEQA